MPERKEFQEAKFRRVDFSLPNKKLAFTLSEVLITVVIIGIVAAITVPMILQSTERREMMSRLVKVNSTLNQAVKKISIDEGVQIGDFSYMNEKEFFDKFSKQVNVMEICNESKHGCFDYKIKHMQGNVVSNAYNNDYALITMDGILYNWEAGGHPNKGLTEEDTLNTVGRFMVDLNGQNPPNRWGYDIYFFQVVKDKGIVPAGAGNNSEDCREKGAGVTCAAKYLSQNKIAY